MLATGKSFCLGSHTFTVPAKPSHKKKKKMFVSICNSLHFCAIKTFCIIRTASSVSALTISTSCDDLRSTVANSKATDPVDAVHDLFVGLCGVHRHIKRFQIPVDERDKVDCVCWHFYFCCPSFPLTTKETLQSLKIFKLKGNNHTELYKKKNWL